MEPNDVGFPHFTEHLVDRLDKLFPDSAPDLGDDDRVVWYKAGQVSVVRFLRSILEERQET